MLGGEIVAHQHAAPTHSQQESVREFTIRWLRHVRMELLRRQYLVEDDPDPKETSVDSVLFVRLDRPMFPLKELSISAAMEIERRALGKLRDRISIRTEEKLPELIACRRSEFSNQILPSLDDEIGAEPLRVLKWFIESGIPEDHDDQRDTARFFNLGVGLEAHIHHPAVQQWLEKKMGRKPSLLVENEYIEGVIQPRRCLQEHEQRCFADQAAIKLSIKTDRETLVSERERLLTAIGDQPSLEQIYNLALLQEKELQIKKDELEQGSLEEAYRAAHRKVDQREKALREESGLALIPQLHIERAYARVLMAITADWWERQGRQQAEPFGIGISSSTPSGPSTALSEEMEAVRRKVPAREKGRTLKHLKPAILQFIEENGASPTKSLYHSWVEKNRPTNGAPWRDGIDFPRFHAWRKYWTDSRSD